MQYDDMSLSAQLINYIFPRHHMNISFDQFYREPSTSNLSRSTKKFWCGGASLSQQSFNTQLAICLSQREILVWGCLPSSFDLNQQFSFLTKKFLFSTDLAQWSHTTAEWLREPHAPFLPLSLSLAHSFLQRTL